MGMKDAHTTQEQLIRQHYPVVGQVYHFQLSLMRAEEKNKNCQQGYIPPDYIH